MKKEFSYHRWRLISLLMVFALLITACKQAVSEYNPNTSLEPTVRDKSIAVNLCRLLEEKHVTNQKIDLIHSHRAIGLYFKAIDPAKIYFTKGDVEKFETLYKDRFATMAVKGDLTAAFSIYRLFIERVGERCQLAHQILDTPLDFSIDEYFIRDKDLIDYPQTDEEVLTRWTQKMKYEILTLEADEREKEQEKKRVKANDKTKEQNEQQVNEVSPETEEQVSERDDSPIAKLHRRYSALEKRIRQITNDDIIETFLTAIANSFDPHSTYMSPKTHENFMIQLRLNLDGIGATLGWEDGYTVVKAIVKGGAADKQGELEVEDRIVGVAQGNDGPFEDVVDMNLTDVVGKIRGKRGTVVRLQVRKAKGKGSKLITIIREKIELDDSAAQGKIFEVSTKADGSPCKVGVIDLPSFYFDMEARGRGDTTGRSTTRDVLKFVREFRQAQVDVCVIDLRFNGGGSLQEVVDLTGLFIETGTVVQVKPSEFGPDKAKSLADRDPKVEWGGPLVVVVSKFSASASEIFAGAIKNYRRGIVVGDITTHGKGTVQPILEMGEILFGPYAKAPNFGTLKVSIQGFYLPNGQSSQRVGVPSDIQIPALSNFLDISEADADYPLSFENIPAVDYPVFQYVTPQLLDSLRQRSKARIDISPEWEKVKKNIETYHEIKEIKKTPLNREKYFAQQDRFNADKEENNEFSHLNNSGEERIKRDYYMDEVLDITADYLNLLQNARVVFEKFP